MAITYSILCQFKKLLGNEYDNLMIFAAMTFAHFGCFRTAEFVSSSEFKFDDVSQLCIGDISFCTVKPNELGLKVRLKVSKTDSTGKGMVVMVGCTGTHVCAVCAMVDYLAIAHTREHNKPVFMWNNGRYLTRAAFVKETKRLLILIGLDCSQYSGHSYRIGAATSAALAGVSPYEIQLLGRWSSQAYQGYLRTPNDILMGFSKRMMQL
jgi:hypothetical protein